MKKVTLHLKNYGRIIMALLLTGVVMTAAGKDHYALANSNLLKQQEMVLEKVVSNDLIRKKQLVSLKLNDTPLVSAFQQLAREVRVGISFNPKVIPDKKVTHEFNQVSVSEALFTLLEGTDLEVILPSTRDVFVIKKKAKPLVKFQDVTVNGQVVSAENGESLPGVTIMLQGTTTGTTTDADGFYSITVPEDGELVFSFVGYNSQTVRVHSGAEINIELEPSTVMLEEAVVTALGLERDRQSMGYSITQVDSRDLVQGTEANIANLLQGQVSGVNVTSTGGGTGSSSRVVIRGVSSLSGDNQPLYVVDGIPINNDNPQLGFVGKAGMWGGSDGGDGIQSLNPADIESMSVLKGASATALYGSAAKDGVILITTKSGEAGGISVNYTNNTTYNIPRLNQLDVQTEYGQGNNGARPQTRPSAWSSNGSSWGERFDGQPTIQFDGTERPYENIYGKGGPLSEFYRTGFSLRNSLSVTGGSDVGTYYLSASNLNDQGVVPSADLNKTSLTVRGTSTFGRLTADVKANYITEDINNRIGVSDRPENPNHSVMQLPRNVPMSAVKNNVYNEDGSSTMLIENDIYSENPYWIINEMKDIDKRDRLIGHANLDFELADWLVLNGRTGLDFYTLRRTSWDGWGTPQTPGGTFDDADYRVFERNTDVMLSGARDLTSFLSVNAMLGGGIRNLRNEVIGMNGSDYIFPGLNVISNMENSSPWYSFSEKEVRSAYGAADFNYNNYLYLNFTGRNDWSSTLPQNNNSYFYPSIGTSFVFSEAFESIMPAWLSFGQLRATWAQVGSDTNPYQLDLTYSIANEQFDGHSYGAIAGSRVPQADLKPTMTDEIELGADIRFFDDRLGIDVAWYDRQTRNQILSMNVSGTSGFSSRTINAGRIDNTGLEMQLTGVPISKPDFFWRTTLNYSRNKSIVVELLDDSQILSLAQSRTQFASITAEVGEEFGTIRGTTYMRDEEGNIIHENGLPVQGPRENLGRGTPTWTTGWANNVTYKNFSLNVLIDVQWGGQIFSGTNSVYYSMGLHKNTLEGRAECDNVSTATGWPSGGCYAYGGVDINGGPNTTEVTPSQYYSNIASFGGGIGEEFVEDNNVIYMRQLQLSYSLPAELVSQFGMKGATISAIARNPFLIYNSVPNIDPTLSLNRGNAQGLELSGVPNTRSFGFNLDLRF